MLSNSDDNFNDPLTQDADGELVLSNDQTKALEEVMAWIAEPYSPTKTSYSLRGNAGTGKTTVLKLVYAGLPYPYNGRTCVSAPTHKARAVVAKKSECKTSETVQSLLGMKPDTSLEDFDIDNVIFAPIANRKIGLYRLIICDEASMINSDLYDLMIKEAVNNRVKILFVGDELQLPPVKETVSRALLEPKSQSVLRQVIRQKDTNPLLIVLDLLRDDITNGTNHFIDYMRENPVMYNDKGEGFAVISDEGEFSDKLIAAFCSDQYVSDRNYVRYLAWTNKKVQSANAHIRKIGMKAVQPIVPGELMLAYNNAGNDRDNIPAIVNSNDYIIGETRPMSDVYGIQIIMTKVRAVDSDAEGTINIVVPTPTNIDLWIGENTPRLHKAKTYRGRAWPEYFAWRNQYVLLDDLYVGKAFVAKKDISYGYGITVHKSQGSTYNTVFVNGKDMNTNREDSDRKKLWYVALSRASEKAIILL